MVAMETHIHNLFVKNSCIHQLADVCFNYPTLDVHKKSDVILRTILVYSDYKRKAYISPKHDR